MNKTLGRIVTFVLIFLNVYFCAVLLLPRGDLFKSFKLQKTLARTQAEIQTLIARNTTLDQEIRLFKKNPETLEEIARSELGLVKPGEIFYRVVEPIE